MCPGDYEDEGGALICALGSPFCAPGGLVRFSVKDYLYEKVGEKIELYYTNRLGRTTPLKSAKTSCVISR